MYKILKKILFTLPPETAHSISLGTLNFFHAIGLTKFLPTPVSNPKTVMGIPFPNPVGLAAGLDKNGDYIAALAALGFGFIEVGTVTPKPQPGNPAPRVFRLPKQEAMINRLGFNNKGCDYLVEKLQALKFQGILGINIGKNVDTPIEKAADDYIHCFRTLAPYASYITVNISSPNTVALRELQSGDLLRPLLQALKQEQSALSKYVPLVVKIAPDLSDEELQKIAEIIRAEKIDGIIATNTTTGRLGVEDSLFANEAGGLSGKPLSALSTTVIKKLRGLLGESIPIIASGGVMSAEDANAKFTAGASLVQFYTGLIYHGPRLVRECSSCRLG